MGNGGETRKKTAPAEHMTAMEIGKRKKERKKERKRKEESVGESFTQNPSRENQNIVGVQHRVVMLFFF